MSKEKMSREDIINWQPHPEQPEELPPARDVVEKTMDRVTNAAKIVGKHAERKRVARKHHVVPDGTIEPNPGGGSTIYRHVNKPKA